jgi:hypothetical protein
METLSTITISKSFWKTVLLVAAAVVMVAASAVTALDFSSFNRGARHGSGIASAIGWFGVAFFGMGLIVILYMAARLRGPIVTLSPEGVLDVRVMKAIIPWSEVTGVYEWRPSPFAKFAMLRLNPNYLARFETNRVQRTLGRLNKVVGAEGLPLQGSMLDISHGRLMDLLRMYHDAFGKKPDSENVSPRPMLIERMLPPNLP